MDTVSYLTINDETKEIADATSRNNIENIAAVIAAQSTNIKNLQSQDENLSGSIGIVYDKTILAQSAADAAISAASAAEQKAESATQAADQA